jgi:hypothetical protein
LDSRDNQCRAVPVVVFDRNAQNIKVRCFEIELMQSIEYFGLVGGRKELQINSLLVNVGWKFQKG